MALQKPLLLLLTVFHKVLSQSQQCDLKLGNSVHLYLPGDVIIGGIFDVHVKNDITGVCTDDVSVPSIQAVEAFLMAVDEANKRSTLQGIKFGN